MTADELVEKVVAAMNAAAEAAYKQNPDIPDEEYDGAKARAAIRAVHEVMREPTTDMLVAIAHVDHANDQTAGWALQTKRPGLVPPRAEYEWAVGQYERMLAASPLAEAARDE